MNRRRILAVVSPFVAGLTFIGGCANPRGAATALSAVIPVSSPAVSSPALASSAIVSTPRDSTQIYGAVTADSERQLVIYYLAGDCTVSARGEATETATSITVRVLVTTHDGVCSAVGYIRSAVVQLAAPWGNRAVLDPAGVTLPVVDGALVLRPSWLPDGYTGGTVFISGDSDSNVGVGQQWDPPDTTQTPSPGVIMCRPTTAGFTLGQGYDMMPPYPLLPGGQTLANGTSVRVDGDDQGDLGLYWTPPGHPAGWTVSLQSEQGCTGYQPLPLDTLLRIANGLH